MFKGNLKTYLIIYSFLLSPFVVGSELVKPCVELDIVDSIMKDLLKDYEKLSRFEAQKLAKELILRQCQHEKDNGRSEIRIRDGKVKFSEFSYSYDVSDPVYFCKNNSGYKAYYSQMTHKLLQFKNKPEKTESNYKRKPSNSNSSKPMRKTAPKVEPMWNCVIPNYIKTVRRVNKAQMETLSITYGSSSCSPAR